MCGIVGAVAQRNVSPILIEGLKRLEYRGYDSAGIAVLDNDSQIQRLRTLGKVQTLVDSMNGNNYPGFLGIAHTRWATHGVPSEQNAHPHMSGSDIAIVHNGIIENHQALREELKTAGYECSSQTDSELIAHLLHLHKPTQASMISSLRNLVAKLDGAYALGIVSRSLPGQLFAVRKGSPLVIGEGVGEYFLASDSMALLPVTRRFMYLEEGDMAAISCNGVEIYNANGESVTREVRVSALKNDENSRGEYRHFMQKEMFQQPMAVRDTLQGRLLTDDVSAKIFGEDAESLFEQVERVQIVACGTSFHAGLVARYWLESIGIACQVDIASEFRYRASVVQPNTLFVCISQSGETADTLAALKGAEQVGCHPGKREAEKDCHPGKREALIRDLSQSTQSPYLATLSICNVPESSLVRESDLNFMTCAGIEVGVASTKAFTTQLVSLLLLTITLGRYRNTLSDAQRAEMIGALRKVPALIEQTLELDDQIENLAETLVNKQHALFLGRGVNYPIALEGALKLKELSYIHAEAYPSGELKHGPLALVDKDMPVIAVVPNDALLEKLVSNLEEVRARGGELILFADKQVRMHDDEHIHTVTMPCGIDDWTAPIIYTLPLQLLAYHVAVRKGTDVDQPRNLAKSVTVE